MRRLLNQAANAAVKAKGSLFELEYRRLVVRLGHAQAIGAIAHRLAALSGRSCTIASLTKNAAQRSLNSGRSVAPRR